MDVNLTRISRVLRFISLEQLDYVMCVVPIHLLVRGVLSLGNLYTKLKPMLRKRCRIKGYVFRRVEFLRSDTEDTTVCEKKSVNFVVLISMIDTVRGLS